MAVFRIGKFMRRNIFTKSMIRQPLRTALLALLLMVAAFSFVLRSMEYIIINERINEISSFFRPIGVLVYTGDGFQPDVRPGAEIISPSPYMNFDDKRRYIEAVLLDIQNAGALEDSGMIAGRTVWLPEDAFFYGTLLDIRHDGNNPYVVLSVEVDAVVLGYPEHVSQGLILNVHYFMDHNEIQTGMTALDGMKVGERYFLRGVYYDNWTALESGSTLTYSNIFVMHPLDEITYTDYITITRYLPRYGVWYAASPIGEIDSLIIPGLERLYEEMHWIRFAQSRVDLRTTMDMSYKPLMQPRGGPLRGVLIEGRWINKEDNESNNPVAVINETFASKRGLSIGDSLRLGIPPGQERAGGFLTELGIHIHIIGEVYAPYAHTLELEIVGILGFIDSFEMTVQEFSNAIVYIPYSILPPDVALIEFVENIRVGEEVVAHTLEEGFILPLWYSFVLNDARDADAFILENSEALGALGFYIEFLPGVAGAQAFWDSAEAIMQTLRFNLALFSIVAVLILVLVVFLYICQRSKDYAILRALGSSTGKTNRQLILTLQIYALPAVIIGGAVGWFVAASEAVKALGALPNVEYIEIELLWLPLMIVFVLASLFIITLVGILLRRRPVLEMLQGTIVKRAKL